jgi:hypothetical protein
MSMAQPSANSNGEVLSMNTFSSRMASAAKAIVGVLATLLI